MTLINELLIRDLQLLETHLEPWSNRLNHPEPTIVLSSETEE